MAETPETPIPPALSVDEWQFGRYVSGELEVYMKSPGLDGTKRLEVIVRAHPLGGSMADPRGLHALAALCLYGQPFGFTQEDVECLRCCAADQRKHMTDWLEVGEVDLATTGKQRLIIAESYRRIADWFDSLADRIAALLPPPNPDWRTSRLRTDNAELRAALSEARTEGERIDRMDAMFGGVKYIVFRDASRLNAGELDVRATMDLLKPRSTSLPPQQADG